MKHELAQNRLRSLPSVDEVMNTADFQLLVQALPRPFLVDCVRAALSAKREAILAFSNDADKFDPSCGVDGDGLSSLDGIALDSLQRVRDMLSPSLRRVVNGTGVIVHTNLGRSPLAQSAIEAVVDVASNYSTLEYDTNMMERGSRHSHCEKLICLLTGAEAAMAVNNNAAAVLMVLSEFASGREAIVSRGELVEIGGSFRVPDIMALSGSHMVEVGTTNKTHLYDYENALTDETAVLLKVHTSNYRLIGFTESLGSKDLVKLARSENAKRGSSLPKILVYEDLGSGALLPLEACGLEHEPTVREALENGCDLVSFSGDKLLGGPQAGIIAGSRECIDRLKRNPLARALRLDKMTLAALEATLRLYLSPEDAWREIPVMKMISEPAEAVAERAERLRERLDEAIGASGASVSVVPEIARAGGGALPASDIPSYAVCVSLGSREALACEEHLVKKRKTPVVPRIKQDCLLFDMRTASTREDHEEICAALKAYLEFHAPGAKGDN